MRVPAHAHVHAAARVACDSELTNLGAQPRRRRRQLQLRQHRRHPSRESLTPPFPRAPVLHGKGDIHLHRSVLRRAAYTRNRTRRQRRAHCHRRGRGCRGRDRSCCAALRPLAAPLTDDDAIAAELCVHLRGG